MTTQTPRYLLIGIGQPFRQDDAVGRKVAQQLLQDPWPGLHVLENNGDGTQLMEAWQDADVVWLVDAVSSHHPPGTIHRFEAHQQPLPQAIFGTSTHHWSLAEAIEMSRVFGQLPTRLIVYGIEGKHFKHGLDLCPEVEAAIPQVIAQIHTEWQELTGKDGTASTA